MKRMLRRFKNELIVSALHLVPYLPFKRPNVCQPPPSLQGQNRNYQKFLVFGHQRSGSSMMMSTLREHPQVVAFGGLFVQSRIGFNVDGYNNYSVKLLYLRNKYPIDFLERYIFSSYREDIKAVGFKVFPHLLDMRSFKCLWQWMAQKRDIKIILLTRRNLLATYTSLLIARKTGKFGIKHDSQRTSNTITIDPDKCIAEFQKRKEYTEKLRNFFKQHEFMEITYEDLIEDLPARFREIQGFLTVDVHELEVRTIKQEVRPLTKVIDNYDELRQHLLETEWNYCCEE